MVIIKNAVNTISIEWMPAWFLDPAGTASILLADFLVFIIDLDLERFQS